MRRFSGLGMINSNVLCVPEYRLASHLRGFTKSLPPKQFVDVKAFHDWITHQIILELRWLTKAEHSHAITFERSERFSGNHAWFSRNLSIASTIILSFRTAVFTWIEGLVTYWTAKTLIPVSARYLCTDDVCEKKLVWSSPVWWGMTGGSAISEPGAVASEIGTVNLPPVHPWGYPAPTEEDSSFIFSGHLVNATRMLHRVPLYHFRCVYKKPPRMSGLVRMMDQGANRPIFCCASSLDFLKYKLPLI